MKFKKLTLGLGAVAALASLTAVDIAVAAETIFVPGLVYRTGAYAPNGVPFANGFKDYIQLACYMAPKNLLRKLTKNPKIFFRKHSQRHSLARF